MAITCTLYRNRYPPFPKNWRNVINEDHIPQNFKDFRKIYLRCYKRVPVIVINYNLSSQKIRKLLQYSKFSKSLSIHKIVLTFPFYLFRQLNKLERIQINTYYDKFPQSYLKQYKNLKALHKRSQFDYQDLALIKQSRQLATYHIITPQIQRFNYYLSHFKLRNLQLQNIVFDTISSYKSINVDIEKENIKLLQQLKENSIKKIKAQMTSSTDALLYTNFHLFQDLIYDLRLYVLNQQSFTKEQQGLITQNLSFVEYLTIQTRIKSNQSKWLKEVFGIIFWVFQIQYLIFIPLINNNFHQIYLLIIQFLQIFSFFLDQRYDLIQDQVQINLEKYQKILMIDLHIAKSLYLDRYFLNLQSLKLLDLSLEFSSQVHLDFDLLAQIKNLEILYLSLYKFQSFPKAFGQALTQIFPQLQFLFINFDEGNIKGTNFKNLANSLKHLIGIKEIAFDLHTTTTITEYGLDCLLSGLLGNGLEKFSLYLNTHESIEEPINKLFSSLKNLEELTLKIHNPVKAKCDFSLDIPLLKTLNLDCKGESQIFDILQSMPPSLRVEKVSIHTHLLNQEQLNKMLKNLRKNCSIKWLWLDFGFSGDESVQEKLEQLNHTLQVHLMSTKNLEQVFLERQNILKEKKE